MLKNSAIQSLSLHETLYYQPIVSVAVVKGLLIPSLIHQRDSRIYAKIKESPFANTCKCLRTYLKLSEFKIRS